jgi:hypothetical protein
MRQSSELAAQALKMGYQGFEARKPERIDGAFAAMARSRVDSVAIQQDPMFAAYAVDIARLALKQRLSIDRGQGVRPGGRPHRSRGGVVEVWRRSAYFVDKILKGTRPFELPVERIRKVRTDPEPQDGQGAPRHPAPARAGAGHRGHPVKDKTARLLGVTIPPSAQVARIT